MQRHDWSSTSPKEPMLHLSLSPCTCSRFAARIQFRHWCLHIDNHSLSTHLLHSLLRIYIPSRVWDLASEASDTEWKKIIIIFHIKIHDISPGAIQKSNWFESHMSHEFIFQIWRRYHKKWDFLETIYITPPPPPPPPPPHTHTHRRTHTHI